MHPLNKKTSLGQFFTKRDFWMKSHIIEFIKSTNTTIAFDPFAWAGDLLNSAKWIGFSHIRWYDIDATLHWDINDSLISIPKIENAIIITNPPYLTNYSAKRKGIYEDVKKYFDTCAYDDIYQIAIENCMKNDFGVMIVPETFINSKFPKNRLTSITVIEDKMFHDTDTPVCVICFDNIIKSHEKIKLYKNDIYIGNLWYYETFRKLPKKTLSITFNSLQWQIALRAVDTTNPKKPIAFMRPEEIDYDLSTIKVSSRLITLIEIWANSDTIDMIIRLSNERLSEFRKNTGDILLSPFKGNKKNGERRRRLDYKTARAIIEDAYLSIGSNELSLF